MMCTPEMKAAFESWKDTDDDGCFLLLWTRYLPYVLAYANYCLGQITSAHDVSQEIAATLIRKKHIIEDLQHFEAIMWTYASKHVRKTKERRQNRLDLQTKLQQQLPKEHKQTHSIIEARDLCEKAIAKLKPKHQKVIKMRVFEGRSTKETAECLDISEKQVRDKKYYALKKLRRIVNGK